MNKSREPRPFWDEVGTGKDEKTTVKNRTQREDRLLELAKRRPFFTATEAMQLFNWEPAHAAQYFWRWKEANRIVPLGGKSDIFFNVLADTHWESYLVSAISHALPHARQTGAHVLQAAGLITQIAMRPEFIVTPRETRFKIDAADIVIRAAVWTNMLEKYKALTSWQNDVYAKELNKLMPGAALLDVLLFERERSFAPDDIDFEELAPDQVKLFLTLCKQVAKTKMVDAEIALILERARIMKNKAGVQQIYEDVYTALRKINGKV